ncbi:alpha-1,3-mannosyl-glycoprotein 4-beta-N-acetylglucosaminyltransferase C-like [Babylonia areolata]|uniref:alpha-1,3-mannosyl-glycoprotein 4-beta-N-acetylglucosaminyltransferase C-like n=1 Tax=Babylonia areolata TaxID=304850 RepID=UPI003FD4D8DF
MTPTKVLRRLCLPRSMGRSSLMVTLVTCVIALQTLILIRMSDDGSRVQEDDPTAGHRRAGVTAGNLSPLSRTLQSSDTESKINPFDLKSCTCGLHFHVDPNEALMLPRPNVTDKKFLTIGIPTVTRRNDSYIVQTVTSLLSNMDAVQQNEVVIVVMIADLDPGARNATLQQLRAAFGEAIKAGSVQVIAPPTDLYTNFQITKQTYGQDYSYVEWRSKQNFDYAYLMRYSAPLSLYYMQLEDDVIVAKHYVNGIRQYIDEQKDSWTCLEFSELGFIGKLFRSKDVDRLSQLLVMFFQEQPVDYTYLYFNMLMTQLQKRIRTPTLFQHQGVHSSFPGKIQPLKDRFFDNMEKRYKGDNPPAEAYTTLKTYLNFLPRLPYSHAEGYFWSDGSPNEGDTFILVFETPQALDRIVIDTGSESHPQDILENAVLKVSLTLMKNSARLECTNDIELGKFSEGKIDVKDLGDVVHFRVVCLQIQVLKAQEAWAIIREIAVFVSGK